MRYVTDVEPDHIDREGLPEAGTSANAPMKAVAPRPPPIDPSLDGTGDLR
jgi:hypothetical protein